MLAERRTSTTTDLWSVGSDTKTKGVLLSLGVSLGSGSLASSEKSAGKEKVVVIVECHSMYRQRCCDLFFVWLVIVRCRLFGCV